MRQVLSVSKTRTLPSWKQWKQLPRILTKSERTTIKLASLIIVLSVLGLGGSYILTHRVEVPDVGGEYTEGLVGEPQFINPLYAATSDVDEDLSSLVFSGLVRWDAQEGFVADLAQDIFINEDGTIYTFTIREDAMFHNGEEVRARDVLFTINAIQNPSYRSPLAGQFSGVSVVQEDDKTVAFILDEPFAPFLERLTVGIMPAGQWAEILPQNAPLAALNLQPIGSGPYQFKEFAKDKKGAVRSYTLERNPNFYREPALIETLNFKFYESALAAGDALENKNVEGVSLVDFEQVETVQENRNVTVVQPLMPRQVVLFFNEQINQVLSDFVLRSAINQALDKEAIAQNLYGNAAQVVHGPILPSMIGYQDQPLVPSAALANVALEEAGYTLEGNLRRIKDELIEEIEEVDTNEDEETEEEEAEEESASEETEESTPSQSLQFTLTTASSAELVGAAELIQAQLSEIGIAINVVTVPPELLFTEVIEPRNFELLLTPIQLGADPDPYLYWHSSQIENGFNLAGYENEEADTLLEEARTTIDQDVRAQKYQLFQALMANDVPAVFLYQTPFSYAFASKIQNVNIPSIIDPSDRFADITSWYIKTKKGLR